MKRQPRILAGSALGLLMASAPLGAYPLQGIDVQQAHQGQQVLSRSASQPIIRIQADCPEGASAEECAKPRAKKAPRGEQAAPAQEQAPAEAEQPKPREQRQKQAEPAPAEQAAPAQEQTPAEAEQPKPRKQRQKQAEPAPAEQAAPAQEQAPAEAEQPKPRKQRQKKAEPAPAEKAPVPEEKAAPVPAGEAPAAEPEQKPRKQRQKQKQAEPAQAEPAPAEQGGGQSSGQAEQPAGEATQPKSKQEKLRDYLKKKQKGEAAPAEQQPAEQAKPAEEPAPKPQDKPAQVEPEQKPAEAAQPPAEAGQAAEPKSKQEKLRDYLKKKKEGGAAAPAGEQPAETAKPAEEGQPAGTAKPQPEAPANGEKPAEATQPPTQGEQAPVQGEQTGGQTNPASEPELPTNTREQALPKGEGEGRPLPKDAAPLPDSAKGAGKAQGAGEQTEGANGKPAGEAPQAGQQPEQPSTGQPREKPEAVPDSDSAAQSDIGKIGKIESVEAVEGKRVDRDRWREERRKRREEQRSRNDAQVVKEINNRIIIKEGDNIYVDNRDVNVRLERNARDSYVEELPDDFSRYTIVKADGTRVVTIRNSYGDIVRRSRITRDNREVVLYYVPESDYGDMRGGYYDAGADLPPLQLDIPADQYILDAQYARPDDYYTYLDAPPVEPVERIYSIDEVVHSARIRDKVRRIDLDTITFDTGSADIGEDQVNHLQALGDAINKILKQNPAETFLIEGHTDAVGSDESNLVLSDERAQAVAEALTSVFDIPAENLTTQGYGERYLKVNTAGANRDNRRVAVRRITPLVAPVASSK